MRLCVFFTAGRLCVYQYNSFYIKIKAAKLYYLFNTGLFFYKLFTHYIFCVNRANLKREKLRQNIPAAAAGM